MDGSVPHLRLHIAGLLDGTIDLNQCQRWFALAETEIEQRGTDTDLDLLDRVMHLLAEFTGDHINARELREALRAASIEYMRVPEAATIS